MEKQEIEQKNQELLAELAKYPEGSKEYRNIASKIVENNVGLVRTIAKKYFVSKKSPTINDDDVISAGFFGLLRAIKLFDPAKGTFSTYAGRWIKGGILEHLRRERLHGAASLEDNKDGTEQKLEDFVASPINVEADFVEKQERQAQIALLKERVNQLPERQRDFLTAKYFSGERVVPDEALAEQFECTKQNISLQGKNGIANLRKMYHIPETTMTAEEKIKTKGLLKDLVLTELPPQQKKTMLCKFYSLTKKTNKQVAQEIESTELNVANYISLSCKKLCTLCDSVKNTKHLKSILEFSPEESEKESR